VVLATEIMATIETRNSVLYEHFKKKGTERSSNSFKGIARIIVLYLLSN
jgi:hypothetical protein